MPIESSERVFITSQLVAESAELSSTSAMARALLRVGRIYLNEGLAFLEPKKEPASIDEYLEEMTPPQAERFAIGVALGIEGCAILHIEEGKDYLTQINEYYAQAVSPIALEPTPRYIQMGNLMDSVLALHPQYDGAKMQRLREEDPTLITILSNFDNMPTALRVHYASVDERIRVAIGETIPLYREAMIGLGRPDVPLSIIEKTAIFRTPDLDWLVDLEKKLGDPPQ